MPVKKDNYSKGVAAERRVAAHLKKTTSAKVKQNPGSRGAEDLKVQFANGRKHFVQVKSSSKGKPKMPTSKELGRLKSKSTKNRATAVIALVDSNRVITRINAHTGKKMR
ncbi:MAG: hypothetical protein K9J17_09695 [Flavobacteriales bacterium]|nr:hypothetical protein [Flavobacteriales bacterium]